MKLRFTFTSLTSLAFLTAFSAGEDKISPVTKFQVGKTYHQTMSMVQDMTTPGGAAHTEVVTDISMKITAGEAKDTKHVTIKYDAMKMKSGMGDKELMNFDSADKEAPKEGATASAKQSLGNIVGKEIDLTLDKDNKVTAVTGMDKLIDNPMLAQMINAERMKELVSQSILMGAPDHAVGKGESWQFSKELPNPMMTISTKGKYTYQSDVEEAGHRLAVFGFTGQLTMGAPSEEEKKGGDEDPKVSQMKQMMKSMGLKLTNGEMIGHAYFDPKLGFVRHADVETEMTMTLNNPQSGEKMEMPTKQKVSVKLTGVEDSK